MAEAGKEADMVRVVGNRMIDEKGAAVRFFGVDFIRKNR